MDCIITIASVSEYWLVSYNYMLQLAAQIDHLLSVSAVIEHVIYSVAMVR